MNKKHLKKEYLERRKQAAFRATWITLATVAGIGLLILLAFLKPVILAILAALGIIAFIWGVAYDETIR